MRIFSFTVFFIILNFLQSEVFAHGPTRQKVSQSMNVNAEIMMVWKIISNFKEFNWNPEIIETIAESNNVGSERVLKFKDGKKITQKLEKINEEKKIISWRITETDNDILPVNSYGAKISVKLEEDGTTNINYKAGFYRGFMGNDPPEELNDENSKKKVSKFIKKSLEGLKKIAEKN